MAAAFNTFFAFFISSGLRILLSRKTAIARFDALNSTGNVTKANSTATAKKTIPVVIQMLVGSNGNRDMGAMMAMLVLAIIPIIIFYLMCQKHIIEGVVSGAVKG